jgi:uncharacterized protein (TIGR00106 family)
VRVSADIQIIPIGVGVRLGAPIAAAIRAIEGAGLQPVTHAHGTSVEGELDAVLEALRCAIEAAHIAGAPRVSTAVKIGSRTDREQSDAQRLESVRRHLQDPETPTDAGS